MRLKETDKLEPGLAGVAGEFYISAELSRMGYPPDKQEMTTNTVLMQAELPCMDRVAA